MENNILLSDDFDENDVIINNEKKDELTCEEKDKCYEDDQDVDDQDVDDQDVDDEDVDDEDVDDEDVDDEDEDVDDEDETTIYVITINDIPYFYENNYEDAKKRINTFSEKIVLGHEKTYDSYYKIINEDEIHIVINLDFILFTYSYTFYKIKIHTARKYK